MIENRDIVMLSADKSNIYIHHSDGKLYISDEIQETSTIIQCKHLYVPDDREAKEGDYVIDGLGELFGPYSNGDTIDVNGVKARVIIAATDPDLCGRVQYTFDEIQKGAIQGLPYIQSSDVIEPYIKAYNEGNPITQVSVELLNVAMLVGRNAGSALESNVHKDISPRPKINKAGEIIASVDEKKYSKEDFRKFLYFLKAEGIVVEEEHKPQDFDFLFDVWSGKIPDGLTF